MPYTAQDMFERIYQNQCSYWQYWQPPPPTTILNLYNYNSSSNFLCLP
jgi:hypothetical protein